MILNGLWRKKIKMVLDTMKKWSEKMEKEFNLKKERDKIFNPIFLALNGLDKHTMREVRGFVEMQDKEFINRVKAFTNETCQLHRIKAEEICVRLLEFIDKLAGYLK